MNNFHLFQHHSNALPRTVKKAYRKLSLQVHPDKESEEISTKKFQILTKVYNILVDAKKRSLYDEAGIVNEPYQTFIVTDAELHDCVDKFAGNILITVI